MKFPAKPADECRFVRCTNKKAEGLAYCTGCYEIRDKLVMQYLPMVHKIANKHCREGRIGSKLGSEADCVQVGVLGLIRAIECFDSGRAYTDKDGNVRNVSFLTYAYTAVDRYISLIALDSGWTIRVPKWKLREFFANTESESHDPLPITDKNDSRIVNYRYYGPCGIEVEELYDSISILPSKWRYAVCERYLHGRKFREIAEDMHTSKAYVAQLCDKAMVFLQIMYGLRKEFPLKKQYKRKDRKRGLCGEKHRLDSIGSGSPVLPVDIVVESESD